MEVPETDTSGPDHSSYPKVVVPSKMTWVPVVRPVRSRVVPEGTAMADKTIVAHDALDLEAEAALVNVHVARLSRRAAAVGAGAATAAAIGEAETKDVVAKANRPKKLET